MRARLKASGVSEIGVERDEKALLPTRCVPNAFIGGAAKVFVGYVVYVMSARPQQAFCCAPYVLVQLDVHEMRLSEAE
jgi:hypothetical protein